MTNQLPASLPRIPVVARPVFDPDTNQLSFSVMAGATLAEIVAQTVPDLPDGNRLRVVVAAPNGQQAVIPERLWTHCRPKPQTTVLITVVPGKSALKSILSIAITIASIALGGFFGPMLAGTLGIGAVGWTSLIALGVNVVGSLLINALIPPPETDNDTANSYQLTGWRNRLDPDGAIPVPLGAIQYAPPFAAISYSEIIGDWQYVRALFVFGYGQLALSNHRIGETPLSDYDEVEIEIRDGLEGDDPLSLFPRQVLQEAVDAQLSRPLPRDDAGEIISGQEAEDDPVTRSTARDTAQASVILFFPGGLYGFDDKQRKVAEWVTLRIEQRHVTGEFWETVYDLRIQDQKNAAFFRQYTWDLPYRGRWQVRVTRLKVDAADEDSGSADIVRWAALQSIRPEYPLAFTSAPLTLVAIRAKATNQLNGRLDRYNALTERICPDYDEASNEWVSRTTKNPAAHYVYALMSPANPRPQTSNQIDWESIEAWHDFCRINGLEYSKVLEDPEQSFREVLLEITAAGRATPRHDGLKWGVTVDGPKDLVVAEISPRNSWGFKAVRSYVDPPDAFSVKFLDETADYESAERYVTRPGYEGDVTLTEALPLEGKTNPDEIWKEATRRWLEVEHRPDTYQVTQHGAVRTVTRGDLVHLSHDVLSRVQKAARVTRIEGALMELDEKVTIEDGVDYALRYRVLSEADTIGTTYVIQVTGEVGETSVLRVLDKAQMPETGVPETGVMVFFGELGQETLPMIVKGVEAGEDNTQIVHMIDYAPQIDELLGEMEIPAWSGRVGDEIVLDVATPGAPRFTSIASGFTGTGTEGRVTFALTAASDTLPAGAFVIEHRPVGGVASQITIAVAESGGTIDDYSRGDEIELRAQTISAGIGGAWTVWIPITVGADDADIPQALPANPVVTSQAGGAEIAFDTGTDTATDQIQVYLSPTASVDRASDAYEDPFAVSPSRAVTHVIGDATRQNLTPNLWTLGVDWAVDGDGYIHTNGTASSLTQSASLVTGKAYRIVMAVTGSTAGTVQARLTGGSSDRLGTSYTGNDTHLDRLEAATGNDTVQIRASADFDGKVEWVVVFEETETCLDQGTWYLWLEPQNDDEAPGPMSGPIEFLIW